MPTPSKHALCSSSSAHRWLNCTAAPRFELNFPSSTSSFAEEGTLAHEFCELYARYKFGQLDKKKFNNALKKLQGKPYYADEMLHCAEFYADHLMEKANGYSVMGGGVAAAIWNQLLDQQDRHEYCSLCREMRGSLLGSVQMLTHHGKPFVANLFSQMAEPDKFDSLTDYRKLRRCLHEVKKFAKQHGYTVAMPGFLGCGIAGGNWDEVYKIILETFEKYPLDVFIVFLPGITIPGEYTVELWKERCDPVLHEYQSRVSFVTGLPSLDEATAYVQRYIAENNDGVNLFKIIDSKNQQIKTFYRDDNGKVVQG